MEGTVGGPMSGLSVLIVEDEFLIAVEAQRIVEEAGAAGAILVSSVEGAREHLAHATPVDIAILDMRLGDGDGGSLIGELNERRIPFVIASGLAPDGSRAGVPRVLLRKPYRDSELIQAMLSALAERR